MVINSSGEIKNMKVNRLNRLTCRMSVFWAFIATICISGMAQEACELYLQTCPENLDKDTIYVPPEVIALSSKIYTCDPARIIEGVVDGSAPPSIVFIIDHSYSMMGWGNTFPGNDTYGSRFKVTHDLIDTIYKVHPDAEIGLVVFREVLYFDHRNNNLLVPLEGQGDQSFMPLLQLNQKIKGNTTGLQALKSILATDTVVKYVETDNRGNVEAVDLVYKPQFYTEGNTNINNAFAAALQAMKSARNPKERQFIIFLSDGIPHPPNNNSMHGGKDPEYFSQGLNTPTTFTVYLNDTARVPPPVLQTLTDNVRNNGYSASNPMSDIWVLKTDYNALMSLFMKNVIKPILTVISGTPLSMAVNSIISDSLSDSGFVFTERFPLSSGTTSFNIRIKYHLKNNNTGAQKDTQTVSTIYVVRKEGAVLPYDVAKICWQRGSLSLYHGVQRVTFVDETMKNLEVRFDPGGYNYQSVTVQVTNKQGTTLDLENLNLNLKPSYWSKTFPREIKKPVRGDNTLQHEMVDSIIVIYRNPKLPLDTLRLSVPFAISKTIKFPLATYNDRNADGFVDSIFVGVSGVFSPEDIGTLAGLITLPSSRGFRVDSIVYVPGGLVYYVRESAAIPQTSVNSKDVIVTKQGMLSAGGFVADGIINIEDRVAPVIISALLVVSATGDSVQVIFSEPVNAFSSSRPFLFRKPGGDSLVVHLDINGNLSKDGRAYTARVRQVEGGSLISVGDSVWINPVALISDQSDNQQKNYRNRRVQISFKQVPYDLIPRVINNPFSPGDAIPPVVLEAYADAKKPLPQKSTGLVIMVEPEEGTFRPGVKLSGKASIYDVVKNPIIENMPMVEKDGKLYYVWNGCNSKGRKVSTGTYVAILSMTDNQDPPVSRKQTIRIGVKR